MWKTLVAIMLGASLGALIRWQLTLRLNYLFPLIPMGTLAANLVGAFIIGLAIAFFIEIPSISAEWRHFIITGFCGGLTTFSTFSAEVVSLFQQGRHAWSMATIMVHVGGSLLMTLLGMYCWITFNKYAL